MNHNTRNIKFDKHKQASFFGYNLQKIAIQHQTPCFVYSEQQIKDSYLTIEDIFSRNNIINYKVNYALKANNNSDLVKFIAKSNFSKQKIGCDIVSFGEFKVAINNDFLPKDIVYSGIGKTLDDIKSAITQKVGQINIESYEEYQEITQSFKQNELSKVRLVLRIKPDVAIGGNEKIATGTKDAKFGISIPIAKKILASANNNIKGLALHIGSQILDYKKYQPAFELLFDLASNALKTGTKIEVIDLGGGFGVCYHPSDQPFDLDSYAKMVADLFVRKLPSHIQLQFEPGRFLLADAGLILTKVVRIKQDIDRNFTIIDCGMNNILRPALYSAYHHIIKLDQSGSAYQNYDIVGPICESSDFFIKNHKLTSLKANDYLAILQAGAYCSVMANNYNSLDIASELVIKQKGEIKLSRHKISHEKLYQLYSQS